jgi:hypothetical protein
MIKMAAQAYAPTNWWQNLEFSPLERTFRTKVAKTLIRDGRGIR